VSPGVVDLLEVVEVDEHEPERPGRARRVVELGGQTLLEAAPVERSGQRVGARDARELAALLLVIARLPGAHDRGNGQAGGEEGHVRSFRVSDEGREECV